jgi:hypothetical protein
MMRRTRPATAEPAMMEVRADEDLDGAEERRDVTIGVTIWEREKRSVYGHGCRLSQ